MPGLDDAVLDILRQRAVQRTRISGGDGGATVAVSALHRVVCDRVGDREDLGAQLDDAVGRLGGKRLDHAANAGFIRKIRRFLGRSSNQTEDVYEFPQSVISRPYDAPH
jgi:hypothetical protein